jgi:hypothetical protein
VQSGALERLGEDNVLGSFRDATIRAWAVWDEVAPPAVPAAARAH